jgi:hypothetical protein
MVPGLLLTLVIHLLPPVSASGPLMIIRRANARNRMKSRG